MNNTGLKGRIALVTGGSKGLGRAMAVALAQNGAHLVLVARDREKLASVANEVERAGSTADVFVTDITQEDQVQQLESQVSAKSGKINILVNNAGTNLRKNITDFTLEEWRGVQDTNLTSVFLMCRAFVPHMKGTGFGRIINMTSIMAHVSHARSGRPIHRRRSRLLGLTRALALELATRRNHRERYQPGAFCHGNEHTDYSESRIKCAVHLENPRWALGQVEEIGALAAFLCGEDAGFITGTDILIDGGWCAM